MDRVTRGKTKAGRLALLDRWLLDAGGLEAWSAPLVVDVGIGAEPHTTVELFHALRERHPGAEVVGTDIDPERVASAGRWAEPGLRFVEQGFEIEVGRPAAVIRAMNVLRQYRAEQVAEAHGQLGRSLAEGGILLEGTCGPDGDVLGCLVLRATDGHLRREALILSADGSKGFAPMMLRDRLPRDLRDRGNPRHPVGRFLIRWTDAWQAVRRPEDAPIEALVRSVAELVRRGEPVDCEWAELGMVVWRPVGGVPEREPGW